MTQQELDAGGSAVKSIAEQKGYGSYIDIDLAREIAAAVIRAVDGVRKQQTSQTK